MFGFKKKGPAQQIVIVQRDRANVTMDEWRSTPIYCEMARKLLSKSETQLMLDVVRQSNLAKAILPDDVPMETRALWQAQIQGFERALQMFESLAVPIKQQEMPEATFEKPETETDLTE